MTNQTIIEKINKEVKQLKAKIKVLGAIKRFETLAEQGRSFAKKKGIRKVDVLKND